ncbi:MAG: hypothetical protein B5M49_04130 [Thermotoga sp. 4484_232]|nr:MAG: hypothetical protein B5M49_04130 [Thermotoga sp. 4484_232]
MTFGLISRKVIAKEDGKINLILPPEPFGIFVVTDERKKMRKSNVRVEITNLSDGAWEILVSNRYHFQKVGGYRLREGEGGSYLFAYIKSF